MQSQWGILDIWNFIAWQYQGQNIRIVPYSYSLTFRQLVTDTQQSNVINILANADFLLLGMYITAVEANAPVEANGTVLITDSGSSEQYTQGPVAIQSYMQNTQSMPRQQQLPVPRQIAGRTTLTIDVVNEAAETVDYWDIALQGVSIYVYGQN